jgi:hypothetical protein
MVITQCRINDLEPSRREERIENTCFILGIHIKRQPILMGEAHAFKNSEENRMVLYGWRYMGRSKN